MAYTGNQATLTNASGWVGVFLSIGDLTELIPGLNASVLATTTYDVKQRGNLIDLQPIPCEVFYDPDTPPPMGESEQWLLTFPIPSGITLAGTGFVIETSAPKMVNNTLMLGELLLQFDGQTGPVFGQYDGYFTIEFSQEFA